MERTKIYQALKGIRGQRPVNLAELEALLVRFSQLVVEQNWIRELDINPLLASADSLLALDARVVLHPADTDPATLPRPAIRPYPKQYVSSYQLPGGPRLVLRPIRPEDEHAMVAFHHKLSEETVYLRYVQFLRLEQRVAHERLARLCFIDYDREMALVAEKPGSDGQPGEIVAVARMTRMHGVSEAEVAFLVRDDLQGRGLGTEMFRRLISIARDEGIARLVAWILPENMGMQRIAVKVGFHIRPRELDDLLCAELRLDAASPVPVPAS
jgi:acetyltransferase